MADFDPSEHSVADVVAYLEQADDDERTRVLIEEEDGKDRATIREWSPKGEEPAGGPSGGEQSEPVDSDDDTIHEFDQTEENAVHLLAAVKRLGLNPSVVTTNDGRLQAPESVVRAADISPAKD